MNKSQLTGPLRYLASLLGSLLVIGGSVILLFEAPRSSAARADTPTFATIKRAVEAKPLPALDGSAFDIAKSVKVVVVGKPEPVTNAAPLSATSPVAVEGASSGQRIVIADAVNLRSDASKTSRRLDVVRTGTSVTVLETRRGWSRVATEDGTTGWLASKFLGQ